MSFNPGDRVTVHPDYVKTDPEAANLLGREGEVVGHVGGYVQVHIEESHPYAKTWLFLDNEIQPLAA